MKFYEVDSDVDGEEYNDLESEREDDTVKKKITL